MLNAKEVALRVPHRYKYKRMGEINAQISTSISTQRKLKLKLQLEARSEPTAIGQYLN